MAPSRRHRDIAELGTQAGCCPDVLGNADPFMERGPEQIEAAELLDDAVPRPIIIAFCDETAEHLVPDDEDARIIAVEIARVGGVMDPVV